jgi:hypothetical protein
MRCTLQLLLFCVVAAVAGEQQCKDDSGMAVEFFPPVCLSYNWEVLECSVNTATSLVSNNSYDSNGQHQLSFHINQFM